MGNRLVSSKTLIVRFSEAEGNVEGIAAKAREALGTEEEVVLADSQGNAILDTDGTRSKL